MDVVVISHHWLLLGSAVVGDMALRTMGAGPAAGAPRRRTPPGSARPARWSLPEAAARARGNGGRHGSGSGAAAPPPGGAPAPSASRSSSDPDRRRESDGAA